MNKQSTLVRDLAIVFTILAALAASGVWIGSRFFHDRDQATDLWDATWRDFAARDDASRFMVDGYRPCVEARTQPLFGPPQRQHDPSVCRSSVVGLAANTQGTEFAKKVDEAVARWETVVLPDLRVKIDDIYRL